jgi:hypothetical protein
MANTAREAGYDYGALAKQRMIWAIKPILGVCIIVWILHPSTGTSSDLHRTELQGFLIGAFYGLFVYRDALRAFIKKQRLVTEVKNRIPEEYYMGHIEKVLRSQDEREV